MNIDEQVDSDTQDPAILELRQWRDKQRAPLSKEEMKLVCETASEAACNASMLFMRVAVKAQLRKVFSSELLIFGIGMLIGIIACKL